MPTDQPDASDLRERVADLEATVSDQQDTIEQLMPSRRQAIVGAGLLGGGLLGGRLSTGTARAQAAGQVGTDTDPVDVQAWDVDVRNLINGGGVLSEGDGTERQVWIIPNGADDPAGADPEDIIFEEQ